MPLPTPKAGESESEYVARCMKAQEGEDKPEDQKLAICYSQFRGDAAMNRKIAFDTVTLDNKILVDDDDYLVMPAVIASEIVHEYEDGWAYKPAGELEKMANTANDIGAVPVKILEHPGPEFNYLVLRQSDVYGRAENFRFVRNLKDPKTGRPMRRGVRADIRWFKDRVPEDVIEKIRNNTLRDVSIGFTRDRDGSSGEFNGVHYDYIQRNIFLNHIAAPIDAGRCPGPICGIGYDAMDEETLKKCPVCRKIKEVGFLTSGERLYANYGEEVLDVIGKDAATEEEQNAQKARSKKYGIAVKEGGNITKPGEYSSLNDSQFADPVNYRYPIDAGHVQAAWAYWSKPENQSQYSSEERAKITAKIKAAMKSHGHEVGEGDELDVEFRKAFTQLNQNLQK